jgi:ribosomal protein S18 acetylase RimI-like enzyme
MTGAVDVRALGVGEHGALVELCDAVLADFPAESAVAHAAPEAFLADPATFVLGAYLDGTPVGVAWGLQIRSPSGRRTTYLHSLDVLERWRRRGIGTALVAAAMETARGQGSTHLWLSTGGHNEAAQALYQRLGGERKPLGDVNYWWQLDDR